MIKDPNFGGPIEGLQHMLQTIALFDKDIRSVNPDGIYGEATKNAVIDYQNKYNLPVTGIVDRETHKSIVDTYYDAYAFLRLAEAAVIHFPASLVVAESQFHPNVYIAQAIFNALRHEYIEILYSESTGIVNPATTANLRFLQRLAGLPETGELDKRSWDTLNRLFRISFDRNYEAAQG